MKLKKTDILDWFIKNAERYDNIRILKTKLENAIFDRLVLYITIFYTHVHSLLLKYTINIILLRKTNVTKKK